LSLSGHVVSFAQQYMRIPPFALSLSTDESMMLSIWSTSKSNSKRFYAPCQLLDFIFS